MRLVTFSDGNATRIGALQGEAVLDITAADSALPKDMLGLIAGGAAMLAA
ncbi:MAG: fumarylacetoacetate hydrolase, partial [Alphaproteobacteria bacterium]|nr:fumarylacetoacetate hydrolase [Alphaproteobacteria bacterium]